MAYDLAFWTDTRTDRPAPSAVHDALAGGGSVDGLGPFDALAMLDALAERFPGMQPPPTEATGQAAWEAPDGQTVFEFTWSPQHLVATARGRFDGDQMNAIIDAGVDIGGGRLYDPQTGERFDG
jgi:hypothetical protein